MLSVSYIFQETGFCFFYYCAVLCCAQIVENIMAQWSYPFVCILHYLVIITMQTYMKVLNFLNPCQAQSLECAPTIKFSSLNHISWNMWGCVFSAYLFSLWRFWEHVNFILLSSSWYGPFAIVRSWNNGMRCLSFYIIVSFTMLFLLGFLSFFTVQVMCEHYMGELFSCVVWHAC